PAQGAGPRKLIVICIDGLDARFLKDTDKVHIKIPVIRKLMRQGVVSDGVIGVLPGGSWAADTTIVTGLTPAQHLVSADEPATQKSKGQTLWQAATAAHRKTALLDWPATVGAEGDYVCPQFWEGSRAVDPELDPIARRCTPGLTERIASVYPAFTKAQWNDASALEALRYLLRFDPPDLTLVHLSDLEGEERETGALSIYSQDVLENDDDLIGQALEKRSPRTLVAIVSDHGFETENYIVRPKVLADTNAVEVKYGLIGAKDTKSAAVLRKAIGSKKTGIAREVPLAEVRRVAPDVKGWVAAFLTMPGYVASDSTRGRAVGPGSHKGVYAVWPLRPNFRSAFVLSGEGVKPGRIGEISMLDIAPTLAEVIGVRLPAARGTSLWRQVSTPVTP
ncbi:MAG: type phosphodiesterase/nucleotide pyrophosphatase, partial [Bryobacterales bacterium]|nr:type phosphodiesterase/nucleotide pyrophosphatase [Bryobacterales bacterium]